MICFWLDNVLSLRPENDAEFQWLSMLHSLLDKGIRVKGEEMPLAWEDPKLRHAHCFNCGCPNDLRSESRVQTDLPVPGEQDNGMDKSER